MSVQTLLDDPARRCRVTYQSGLLTEAEASDLFQALRGAPFEQETPAMRGGAVQVARASCAFGEPGRVHRYAGLTRVAQAWPEALRLARARVEAAAGVAYPYCLANLYPDGRAGLGWHSDDEPDLETGAPIASLSMGAERDFAMRWGNSGAACLTVPLEHGSLLVMRGATQRFLQHRVPPRAGVNRPRINLTFRRLR